MNILVMQLYPLCR